MKRALPGSKTHYPPKKQGASLLHGSRKPPSVYPLLRGDFIVFLRLFYPKKRT